MLTFEHRGYTIHHSYLSNICIMNIIESTCHPIHQVSVWKFGALILQHNLAPWLPPSIWNINTKAHPSIRPPYYMANTSTCCLLFNIYRWRLSFQRRNKGSYRSQVERSKFIWANILGSSKSNCGPGIKYKQHNATNEYKPGNTQMTITSKAAAIGEVHEVEHGSQSGTCDAWSINR